MRQFLRGLLLMAPLWIAAGGAAAGSTDVLLATFPLTLIFPAVLWAPRTWGRDPAEHANLRQLTLRSIAAGVLLQFVVVATLVNDWAQPFVFIIPLIGTAGGAIAAGSLCEDRARAWLTARSLAPWATLGGGPAVVIGAIYADIAPVAVAFGLVALATTVAASSLMETLFPEARTAT